MAVLAGMPSKSHIRIGTRGSPLALAQTKIFAESVKGLRPDWDIEIVAIKTSGDKIQDRFLSSAGGKGLFTKEIEDALIREEIDLAVHSLKDLPAQIPEDLTLACLPKRLSYQDVLVTPDGKTLEALPAGATIGTVSLRRRLQLQRQRSDLNFALLRGNIDTRLKRLMAGEFAAIILAQAGIMRLGLQVSSTPIAMIPAPGQGCLAIEINRKNEYLLNLLKPLHDSDTEWAVKAERRLMKGLGGECNLPLGALGEIEGPELHLKAFIASPDGTRWIEEGIHGLATDAEALADRLLEKFFAKGAREILDSIQKMENENTLR